MSDESMTLESLTALIRDFVIERDWQHFHTPSALAISASIEMGELLERFQWLSDEEIVDLLKNEEYQESIADEISDILIYMIRLADTSGIQLTESILRKMQKNEEKYPSSEWKGRILDKVRNPR